MLGGFILQASNTEKVTTTATQMLQALSTGDSSTARYAMQWNPLSQNGRRVDGSRITRNRIVEQECKLVGESWKQLKQIA